ncbi:ATP-binding protein [Azospirillum griseum]|uniref:sensor histidine kinase n=1 Tax=Azospirillum griseum TaxID=2496639 RepID=UPI001AEC9AB7|nr:ATP-binding protein [Azospirillum griseum]
MSAFGLVLIFGLNAMIGADLLREHDEILGQAWEETQSLSLILERQATDSVAGVAKILAGTAEVLNRRPYVWDAGDLGAQALLRRQAALSPLIHALLVVSADGKLIHDSTTMAPMNPDLSDREYLTIHDTNVGGGLYVGTPVFSRVAGAWLVTMSRRLEANDGRFAGAVVAMIDPTAFRSFYEAFRLRNGTMVTLYHANGPMMARYPDAATDANRVAQPLPPSATRLKPGMTGTEHVSETNDGPDRIISHRRSADLPLVVTVSMATDRLLQPWRGKLVLSLVITACGSAMLAFLTFALVREAGRREAMLADLQNSERALRDSQQRLIQDIAGRYRAEAELIAAKQASDAANRAKTQFLANMSHELRTPLNAIIGFAEALETGIFGQLSGKPAEYIGDIRRSGQHLLSLINDILDTTKIESGKYALHEEVVNIRDTVEESLRSLTPQAAEKSITLTSTLPEDPPCLFADERAMRQVLLNLLSNALKFTPVGGRVAVMVDVSERNLRLRVIDTGIGIPQGELTQVLEPFHQVDNSHTRRYAGTGLGLPLVKSLVEMQEGRFLLTSAVGRGTTATILFPISRLRRPPPVPPTPDSGPTDVAATDDTTAITVPTTADTAPRQLETLS